MYDPADQPTIEQILNFHDVVDYLQPEQFAALLQELELRDSILREDAISRKEEAVLAELERRGFDVR